MLIMLACIGIPGSGSAQTSGAGGMVSFLTADRCIACHSNIHSASGDDVSIGYAWRASMMANSARDPYWFAAVRREVTDHPLAQSAIEDKCSTCHMPMARYTAAQLGGTGEVFANMYRTDGLNNSPFSAMARDGVSCTVCHQITEHAFGEEESFTGGFEIAPADANDGSWQILGPHEVDAGRQALMHSATTAQPQQADHLARSELCATCHTLYTHALDENGAEIGELAEQVPYLEWRHSAFRETTSCQDCHMPELAEPTPITSVLGEPRPRFSQHVFRGGNAFMLGVLNKYRNELGVQAPPQEFNSSIRRTREYLGSEAAELELSRLRRAGERIEFDVHVTSKAGHKLPTAYPSRRVWLHIVIEDAAGDIVFESGRLLDNGAIDGNDNDVDGSAFEPHYEVIEAADQVQIYEPILGDAAGNVTTGLLRGVRYLKDNRLLPEGFDKSTAEIDIAVAGNALTDPDFTAGSDTIRYRLAIGAADAARAATVRATLYYQSIGYRWAENLREYRTFETDRFVRYYQDSIKGTEAVLARRVAEIR